MENSNNFSLPHYSLPVLILGSDHHGALGLTRSLGRLGVPIYCIDSNPKSVCFHSRYCVGSFNSNEIDCTQETLQFLLKVGRTIKQRCLVIPTTDDGALLVAENYNLLKENYICHPLSPILVRSLSSKKEMYYVAKKNSTPTPETCFPTTREEVIQFSKDALFPVMLKAIDGKLSLLRAGHKMFVTKTKEQLLDYYDRYEDPEHPNYMLQEYIPGNEDSVWMFNGYFNSNSDCLFAATGKKIRQSPVYTGATSLGICLNNEIVKETSKRLMKRVGYRGIVDIGYRYDERDGQYKILDINPRIGQTFRLFVGSNGIDCSRAQYLDLTNQKVPKTVFNEGRKWIVEDKDLISSIRYIHDGKLSLMNWFKSFSGIKEFAWFAIDDPLPFFLNCQRFFNRSAEHLLKLSDEENNQPFWEHFGTTP
jgi:D-aspartate ligase